MRNVFTKSLLLGLLLFVTSYAAAQSQLYLNAEAGIGNEWGQATFAALNMQKDTAAKGDVQLRLRGSGSRQFPKHSYTLRSKEPVALIDGSKPLKQWVLYALYYDAGYIRAALAFQLARATGRYAPAAQFCELYLNGKYDGIYAITEYISREALGLDGSSFIFKIDKDKDFRSHGWASRCDSNVRFFYHDPKEKELEEAGKLQLRSIVDSLEVALAGSSFQDTVSGWRRFMDKAAAIDYFLLEELLRPVDAYRSSTYFTKRATEKIEPGPVWDFDQSMGNSALYDADSSSGWQYIASARCGKCLPKMPFWWKRLRADSGFVQAVRNRWISLRSSAFSDTGIAHRIDSMMLPAAIAAREEARWPFSRKVLPFTASDHVAYLKEILLLKHWLRRRAAWLDAML